MPESQPIHSQSPATRPPVPPAIARVQPWIGLLLYAALTFAWFPEQNKLLRSWLPGMTWVMRYVIGHVAQLAEILLFAWAASRVEGRSFAAYGLPWRQAFRARFWQGAAVGTGSLTVLVLALVAVGGLDLEAPTRDVAGSLVAGAGYLLLFFVLGLREEFLFRGYGLSTLAGRTGFWPAAIVTSAWFVTGHTGNAGETALGLTVVGLFGIFACVLLRRTGSLWMPIGFHATWDWCQTYLFGVGDSGHPPAPGHFFTANVPSAAPSWLSGGATGPEGSVLCVALVAVLTVVAAGVSRRNAPT